MSPALYDGRRTVVDRPAGTRTYWQRLEAVLQVPKEHWLPGQQAPPGKPQGLQMKLLGPQTKVGAHTPPAQQDWPGPPQEAGAAQRPPVQTSPPEQVLPAQQMLPSPPQARQMPFELQASPELQKPPTQQIWPAAPQLTATIGDCASGAAIAKAGSVPVSQGGDAD